MGLSVNRLEENIARLRQDSYKNRERVNQILKYSDILFFLLGY